VITSQSTILDVLELKKASLYLCSTASFGAHITPKMPFIPKFSASIGLLLLILQEFRSTAFVPHRHPSTETTSRTIQRSLSIKCPRSSENSNNVSNRNERKNNKDKKVFTLKDLRDEIAQKPAAFLTKQDNNSNKKKSQYRRSRKRIDNPQQQYVYAKQRRENSLMEEPISEGLATNATHQPTIVTQAAVVPVQLARDYGLTNPAAQHCDPLVDTVEPEILGQLRVGDATTSGSYAYIIAKPAGWAILGGGSSNPNKTASTDTAPSKNKRQSVTRLEITDVDGSKDTLEFGDDALLAVMTPEEIAEYRSELDSSNDDKTTTTEIGNKGPQQPPKTRTKKVKVRLEHEKDEDEEDLLFANDNDLMDEEVDMANIDFEERELLFSLTLEDLAQFERDMGPIESSLRRELEEFHAQQQKSISGADDEEVNNAVGNADDNTSNVVDTEFLDPNAREVYFKIQARKSASKSASSSFSPASRPSVVAWLKDLKAEEGSPMKGGKYWTALAGATDVDDSGIVILCPKEFVENVFVDYLEYIVVIGNDKNLAPKQKVVDNIPRDELTIETLSTVRRNRGSDTVQTIKVLVQESFSSCTSIVQACQQQFQDGIRGDPAGNPLGRLANRRLAHCSAVSVSSLLHDESVEVEIEGVPDDIAILAERRNQHQYKEGSFLGRSALRSNPMTNAYREINGAADGFPGWTVDRYDKWLFVQHDDTMPRGPLPSIHDGNTAGVYYLPANPNRSAMGSDNSLIRPRLLEGQPAPDVVDILENGITYQVSLDKDLSTGIFLDQRPQRAWLARNCNGDTHVLNCFAHCGGYSIAASTAGASTTSIDLSKNWLNRVEPQLEANGIDFDVRHDCIYGDCKSI